VRRALAKKMHVKGLVIAHNKNKARRNSAALEIGDIWK
jgi:hypothetical protein